MSSEPGSTSANRGVAPVYRTAFALATNVIGVVIAVGAIVGRTGVLGDNARMVLNRVAFHVGVPALLLLSLSEATLDQIFSLPLLVSAIATLLERLRS